MTKLSVNINKIATLRNARGADNPNVVKVALNCERFGAQGITVHPRPDERHIRYQDAVDLAKVVTTEFNIEGYPDQRFMQLIREVKPAQATLVPDPPNAITSNTGWDTIAHQSMLKDIVAETTDVIEKMCIETALELTRNNRVAAADMLSLSRQSLYVKLRKYGLLNKDGD